MVDSREKQRLPCWCFSGELFMSICNVAVWGRSALCEVQMSASRVGGCAQVSATSNGSVTPRSNFTGFPQFIDDQKTAGTEQQHSTECRHKCQWPPTDATQLPPIQLYADTSKLFCFMQTSLLKQVCFMQTSLFCLRQTPPNNPACGRHLQCNKTGNFIQCRNWKRNTLLKSKTDSEASRPNNKSCFSVEISESKTCFPQNSPPSCWSKANFPVESCPVWNWEETLQVALGKLRRERIPTPDGTFSTNFLSSCWSHSGVSTYMGEGSQVIKLKIPLPHHNNPDQCV